LLLNGHFLRRAKRAKTPFETRPFIHAITIVSFAAAPALKNPLSPG
jgi:hypothetical protein